MVWANNALSPEAPLILGAQSGSPVTAGVVKGAQRPLLVARYNDALAADPRHAE